MPYVTLWRKLIEEASGKYFVGQDTANPILKIDQLRELCGSVRDVSDPRSASMENRQSPHDELRAGITGYIIVARFATPILFRAPVGKEMIVEQEKAAENSNALPAPKSESIDVKKPSGKSEWRRRHRVELLLLLLLWSTFAYFYQATQQNETVRFDLTRAIVQDRTVAINKYWFNSADVIHYSRNGEDRVYSNKAPGTSLLAIPGFLIASAILKVAVAAGLPQGIYWHLVAYVTIISTVSLLSALAAVGMYLVLKRMTGDVGFSLLAVLAVWLGTLMFPFSTLFFSHAQAAAQLALAFYLLFRVRNDGLDSVRRTQVFFLLAGVMLGFTFATEYPTVLLGGILTVYGLWIIVRQKTTRQSKASLAGALALGLLIGGGVLAVYNLAAYGKVIYLPYEAYAKPGSPFPTYTQGLMGMRWPGVRNFLSALAAVSIYPPIGLLYIKLERWGLYACNPVLWLALPGLGLMLFRRQWRAEGIVVAAMIVAYMLFITSYGTSIYDWGGGGYIGSRHLVPLLPFLTLPLYFGARKLKWVFYPLFALSVFYMLIGTAVEPRVNYPIAVPARDLHLPDYLRGRLAQNSEGLFEPAKLTTDSTAFNLAKLARVPGRYQLAPLMLWWFLIGSALLLTIAPRQAVAASSNALEGETDSSTGSRSGRRYVPRSELIVLGLFLGAIAVAPIVHYQRATAASGGKYGLRGTYYRSANWTGDPAEVKLDPNVDFDWSTRFPFPPPFSVDWTGSILIEQPGDYNFALVSDDGSYLEIDGKLVVDARRDSVFAKRFGRINLARGSHAVRLRYFNILFGGSVRFFWTPPGRVEQIVPTDVLRPPHL
jgi:PA14 domain